MIPISDIPATALRFLRKYVQSVWQLELILLLRSRASNLTSAEIAKEMYMSADFIEKSGLSYFERAGIVKSSSQDPKTYWYQPTPDLCDAVDQALNAYIKQRVQVIGIIFAAPIQNFSDAFKLRQEDDL